tara:strand:+ start:246 stop:488 length:243 start_codon:yes stop_codon:yes gene_type:complete
VTVLWAKELGIDLEKLKEESPGHSVQVFRREQHEKEVAVYWETRFGREGRLRELRDVAELELLQAKRLLRLCGTVSQVTA